MLDRKTREAREMEVVGGVTVNLYIIYKKIFKDHSFEEVRKMLEDSYEIECGGISRRYKGMTFDRYVAYKRRQLCHLYGFDDYGNELYLYDVGVILYDPEYDEEPEVYVHAVWGINEKEVIDKVNAHFAHTSDYQGIQSINKR